MDYSTDLSFRLSFFNSIFELIAGFNFAYAGISNINQFTNSYLLRLAKKAYLRFAKAFREVAPYKFALTGNFDSDETQSESDKILNLLHSTNENYKKLFRKNFIRSKAKVKFIPVFTYVGFYCLFVLFLSGLAESQQIINFDSDISFVKFNGQYSFRNCTFLSLFFFNLFSTSFLTFLVLRDWNKRTKITRERKFMSPLRQFVWSASFFSFSIILSVIIFTYLHLFSKSSILFDLCVLLWAILLGLAPMIALTFWSYIGLMIKTMVNSKMFEELIQHYHYISSPFSEAILDINKNKRRFAYLNDNQIFLNFFMFFKLYWKHSLSFSAICILTISLLYNMIKPQDEQFYLLIKQSLNREFMAYKNLPKLDTVWFKNFYTHNGDAQNKLLERLIFHKNRNEVINNHKNPSNFEYINGRIIEVDSNRVIVETKEYWYNKWYNIQKNKYTYEYKDTSIEPQIYILKKVNGKWLIDKNNYIGSVQIL
jgi:hypothetical protein